VTRRLDVAALPTGPRDPVLTTPPRRPGSVRRTITVDQHRFGPGEPQRVVGRGRDLRTRVDGTAEVVDHVDVDAMVEGVAPTAPILSLTADPAEPALAALVGHPASKGFRARLDDALPEHRRQARLLHQVLDDLPMALLISSYGWSLEADQFELPPDAADRLRDQCSGWVSGGTMLGTLHDTGIFPIPPGLPADGLGPTAEDPLAWHELPVLPPRSTRRRRRLDLSPGSEPDGPLELDVHFRDSHLDAAGVEHALHEYTVAATLDPGSLVVRSCSAVARVLPWPECPGSLASAARVVGDPVSVLRAKVAVRFTGTSTCTHLNDLLRSMSSATALAAAGVEAGT
jgi:hypothetical protein